MISDLDVNSVLTPFRTITALRASNIYVYSQDFDIISIAKATYLSYIHFAILCLTMYTFHFRYSTPAETVTLNPQQEQ